MKKLQTFEQYSQKIDNEILKYINGKYLIKDNLMIVGKFNKHQKYNYMDVSNDIQTKFNLTQKESLNIVEMWKDKK